MILPAANASEASFMVALSLPNEFARAAMFCVFNFRPVNFLALGTANGS